MKVAWAKLGLRGRLAISIGTLVLFAFAVVFAAVHAEMADESSVIKREEALETGESSAGRQPHEGSAISPIEDAQSEVERTFVIVGGVTLVAALLAGYLLAARTAAPLRRIASTAAEVDGGDLTPRLELDPTAAVELRILVEAFNHMLDRLDRAFARQRQFVSNASHELRTPLTAIRGQLEVLARNQSPGAEEVRRVEAMTMIEVRRMERLVDDLLTLARLDEGDGPSFQDVQATPFLQGLAGTTPGETTELGELADGTISIDPDLIAQVVRNLLANAHRHAGPNGRVALSTRAADARLVVTVDDDGPGVPREHRERVFERFHRSEPSRARASGGSGLGLAIARSIVDMHGGRIWVTDSPLGGARVEFELDGFEPQLGRA
jgi:two-component system OmpR family sensor kinase